MAKQNIFEIPHLISLLPDLKHKKVLDLGCGFGEHCMYYIQNGAEKVVGIDVSELRENFDIVVNSLTFHYVENFDEIVKKVHKLLSLNGSFIFSQETPLCTCYMGEDRWTKDEPGKKIYLNLANYGIEGERESVWFVDHVKKYHRIFSTIMNTLIENGFTIEKMIEPLPTEEILEKYPQYKDLYHKPDFLLVKVKK